VESVAVELATTPSAKPSTARSIQPCPAGEDGVSRRKLEWVVARYTVLSGSGDKKTMEVSS
jgi:hypothetical protein